MRLLTCRRIRSIGPVERWSRNRVSIMASTEVAGPRDVVATARRDVGFARVPVLLITAALFAALLATSGRYGYFADELYFVAAGHELSWGYADQTPLVPLIALVMDTLFPGSLVALRLPAMLVISSGVALTALVARELGGDRRAQTLAGGAWAVSGNFVGMGHMLATASFDPVLWTVVLWLLVRWVRLRELGHNRDHLLLWAGVATAVAMQVKFLIPTLWLVLIPVVLVTGPREMVRRVPLWAGGAITIATTVPSLWWQAEHGWPQLEMREVVAAENWWGPLYLPVAALCAGVAGTALGGFGLWRLLRAAELHAFRFLGWSFIGVTAVFVFSNGRPYYVAGFFGLLFAVGAVELQRRREAGARSRRCWPVYAVSVLVAAGWLPVLPISAVQPADVISTGSIGWPQITSTIARHYDRLPSDTAVLTHDYWTASALRHYGGNAGLPEVHSPGRGFWYFGKPDDEVRRAIYLGADRAYLARFFNSVRPLGTIDTQLPAETQFEGEVVWLVEGPKEPWSQLWPKLRHMGLHD